MNRSTSLFLSMKDRIFKIAAFASCIALGTSMALAFGEHTALRVIQTQTILIRHKATEEQRRAAERNAKAFFSQIAPNAKLELQKNNIHAVLRKTTRTQ